MKKVIIWQAIKSKLGTLLLFGGARVGRLLFPFALDPFSQLSIFFISPIIIIIIFPLSWISALYLIVSGYFSQLKLVGLQRAPFRMEALKYYLSMLAGGFLVHIAIILSYAVFILGLALLAK